MKPMSDVRLSVDALDIIYSRAHYELLGANPKR